MWYVAVCMDGEKMEENVPPYKRDSVLVRGDACDYVAGGMLMLEVCEWK